MVLEMEGNPFSRSLEGKEEEEGSKGSVDTEFVLPLLRKYLIGSEKDDKRGSLTSTR